MTINGPQGEVMAKTRVYELARDLNLTNQILLNKLNELDISVKSHMSALDDEVVDKLRHQLYGKKEETIVETRIKPTVIRRRRKEVRVEAVPAATPVPEEAAADAAETIIIIHDNTHTNLANIIDVPPSCLKDTKIRFFTLFEYESNPHQ